MQGTELPACSIHHRALPSLAAERHPLNPSPAASSAAFPTAAYSRADCRHLKPLTQRAASAAVSLAAGLPLTPIALNFLYSSFPSFTKKRWAAGQARVLPYFLGRTTLDCVVIYYYFYLGGKKKKKKELERVVRMPGLRGYGHVYMHYLMWLVFIFFSIHYSHWKGLGIITLIKTQTTKSCAISRKKVNKKY